ncbi:MAG: hypothetical protein V4611_03200 [Patescibacteria group bacterium]
MDVVARVLGSPVASVQLLLTTKADGINSYEHKEYGRALQAFIRVHKMRTEFDIDPESDWWWHDNLHFMYKAWVMCSDHDRAYIALPMNVVHLMDLLADGDAPAYGQRTVWVTEHFGRLGLKALDAHEWLAARRRL